MRGRTRSALYELSKYLGLLIAVLVFFLYIRSPQDADMWWHLRAGQVMWQTKSILLVDKFSYTRIGQPWVNAFWISELILYLVFKSGGYIGLTCLVSLIGGATFYALYRNMRGNAFVNAFVVLLAAITAAPVWGPRPQILSFLLLALLDWWLEYSQNKHRLSYWFLIPIFILWANVHGGWIWGFLLLMAHITGNAFNKITSASENTGPSWKELFYLFFWTLAAIIAIGINPNGISIWKLPFRTVDVSMNIQEWASPDFHQLEFHPFLWMLFLLLTSALVGRPKVNWGDLFKVVGFAYLTFISQRNIGPFAIVTAPILAKWANSAVENLANQMQLRNTQSTSFLNPKVDALLKSVILIFISLAAIGRIYVVSIPSAVNKGLPTRAVQWLKENPPSGPLFNSYNWGGYLTWALPQIPVFIDGRADLYGKDIISQWQEVVQGTPEGFAVLEKWHIQAILLEPSWPIVKLLPYEGWTEAYHDNTAVIFIK